MKDNDIYELWAKRRSRLEVSNNLAENVMRRIRLYETRKRPPLIDVQSLLDWVTLHSLAKAALIAAGAVTGFARIWCVAYALLGC
jgi:hypothetical protein